MPFFGAFTAAASPSTEKPATISIPSLNCATALPFKFSKFISSLPEKVAVFPVSTELLAAYTSPTVEFDLILTCFNLFVVVPKLP